jgi:hypothetical protein
MKKTMLVCFVVLFAVSMAHALDNECITEYTWKVYYQNSSTCSDSARVYFCKEIRFKTDMKVYNKTGTTQIGTWNNSEGSLDIRVYLWNCGLTSFDLTVNACNTAMMLGGGSGKLVFLLRYASL